MVFRVGIDIGGTFTDIVVLDESGRLALAKTPSTPKDYSEGFLEAIRKAEVPVDEIEFFAHGTTVCINAIIQGNLPTTGLITTRGFRDVLEIGRGNRVNVFDPFYKYPTALIPRRLREEVTERVLHDGSVRVPLSEAESAEAVRRLRDSGVVSIAVCLLHSYANPDHEERVKAVVSRDFPSAFVTASHEVSREYYDYERMCTTAFNASLMPLLGRYLTALEAELRKRMFKHELHIMQSNGGVMTATVAKRIPVMTINSGLVGGIIAVRTLSRLLGFPNVIGADMGGTSFDVELVLDHEFQMRELMNIETPRSGPSGYPILTPTAEIHAIGAGGGSIAWVDEAGDLHVGPRSAASEPGPACYGKGGTEPTVTDANVVLERLNPGYFLGGEMSIYPELSRKAVGKIADRYGMKMEEAASGILKIVVTNMAGAINTMTVKRGIDPRELRMISFGGAGPLHCNLIQRELQIPEAVITTMPGNTSAWGMLMTDLRHDYVQTYIEELASADCDRLEHYYRAFEEQANGTLREEGVGEENREFVRSLDIRYVGQGHPLTIPIWSGGGRGRSLAPSDMSEVGRRFDEQHLRTYLHNAPEEAKEIMALRFTALGLLQKPTLPDIERTEGEEVGGEPGADSKKGTRRVFFDDHFEDCAVYDRRRLMAGNSIAGPAIIEETTSTTVVLPEYRVLVDRYGHLIIKKK